MNDVAERAAMTTREFRSYEFEDFEFRDDGPTGFTFEGVAAVVDRPYEVRDALGTYSEIIRSGAFNKTLRDGSAHVGLYVNHNHRFGHPPLATRAAGTLKITADPNLRVRADLDPSRPDVQIVASAVKRGEMRQMSVGFDRVKARDEWNKDYTEVVRNEVILVEASITELGCSTTTSASIRSFDDFMASITDVEMTDDEIRRAISSFQARLAPVEDPALAAVAAEIAERDRIDRERLERLRLIRV